MLGWRGEIREAEEEKVLNLKRSAKGNLRKWRMATRTSFLELKMQKVEQLKSLSNIYIYIYEKEK